MDDSMSLAWRFPGAQIVAAIVLAACGGGDGGPAPPVLTGIDSTERPQVTSCDLKQARVMVDEIRITLAGAGSIDVTLPEPRPVDLLDPGTGILEALQVAPLTRDALAVRLDVARGSTVRLDNGTEAPLRVAGHLRLAGDFRLASGMVADLVVQGFDRCNAIQAAGLSGQFVLKGEVPAQVRALPFVTDREQAIGGSLRPVPGNGYATVHQAANSFTVQRFNAYATPLGTTMIDLPDGTAPSVTPLANGDVLATWLGPPVDPEIPLAQHLPLMVQRFGADGTPRVEPLQVALTQPFTSRTSPPNLPQVAALQDGGAALVWVQLDSQDLNVYLERFAADGSTALGAQRVNVTGVGALPNVVGLADNRVLVAWGIGSLFARVFEANGSAGAEQAIAPAATSVFGPPQLAALADGGAAVAWTGLVLTRFSIIEILRLTPEGAPIGSPQLVADGITPSIAVLPDGNFVVTWFTLRNVVARRFAPDGAPQGAFARVNLDSSAASGPSVVALSWGGFLIGWTTFAHGNPQEEVMRFFDAQGLLGG